MPRYYIGNKKQPNVKSESAWVTIPVKPKEKTIPNDYETYLVQPRIADYIVLLESKIKGELPKLPKKRTIT